MESEPAMEYEAAIHATLGPAGRMISGSKVGYRDAYPDHLPVFNANVCLGASKVWHGDLDLTVDEPRLIELAARSGQITYVLYESDGRFKYEDEPRIGEAVYSAAPTGHTRFDPTEAERRADGRLHVRPSPRPPRWRRPAPPALWRFWKVDVQSEASRIPEGRQTSRFLRFGRHGTPQRTPLLVLGLHTWSRDARGAWVEWTWYPAGHRAWAPQLSGRFRWHRGRVRPYIGVRAAPGLAYELRTGVIAGPMDLIWG